MKRVLVLFLCLHSLTCSHAQTVVASGQQPQVDVDPKGTVRIVYGLADAIHMVTSTDQGRTFSPPRLVGHVTGMHLGMTRGPQVATSRDFSIVTAMDKKGDIHLFRLDHQSDRWEKLRNLNDVAGSAPEGLMSIACDDNNNFFAVWLDTRENGRNNICFASSPGGAKWTPNRFVYKSPDQHVCECCRPSVAARNGSVAVMFRNWLNGSRDLYLLRSPDGGANFGAAEKLGNGTWKLNACPMDGGGLYIDGEGNIHTAWRREGDVFYSMPGNAEEKLGEGRGVAATNGFVGWEAPAGLNVRSINGSPQSLGEGTALSLKALSHKTVFAAWQLDDRILFHRLSQ